MLSSSVLFGVLSIPTVIDHNPRKHMQKYDVSIYSFVYYENRTTRVHMHRHMQGHMQTHTCVHTHAQAGTDVQAHMRTHAHVCTNGHTCMHTRTQCLLST